VIPSRAIPASFSRACWSATARACPRGWRAGSRGDEVAAIQTSFLAEGLLRQDNFVSLLYYLGLLSFAGEREGRHLLRIPNRTVRQLMYGYLRDAYDEVGVFRPSTYTVAEKLRYMAYRGEWQGFFDYLAEEIGRQASVRDYLQGEKMIQGFLFAWLNLLPYFQVFSEAEQAGGFVDLYLAPFYFRYPDMHHAYLIELKFLAAPRIRRRGAPGCWTRPARSCAAMPLMHGCMRPLAPPPCTQSCCSIAAGSWSIARRCRLAPALAPLSG
jgi:hypothetical protein